MMHVTRSVSGQQLPDWHGCWADELSRRLDSDREALRPVINLTGTKAAHQSRSGHYRRKRLLRRVTNAMRWPVTLNIP